MGNIYSPVFLTSNWTDKVLHILINVDHGNNTFL